MTQAAHKALAWKAAALAALGLACVAAAQAQETVKCLDQRGRVTYSNTRCEDQGLKHGGVVEDRTMVIPAQAPAAKKRDAAKKGAEKDETRELPQVKPVNPLIDRMLK